MDKRIGAQLYTLRDYCKTAQDFDKTLKKLYDIGYKVIQISAVGPIPAAEIKEICDKYNMTVACTHNFNDDLQSVIDYHKTIGCDIVGLGAMRPPEGSAFGHDISIDYVKSYVKDLDEKAKILQDNGLTFAYHNHAFEFAKDSGRYLMDYILESDYIKFIVDVYWLAYAGINPAKYIKTLEKKAVCIHFKDLAIVDNQIVMAEVMEGNLDWDEIISAAEEAGSKWALVEQDVCRRDPFESLKISYNNLKTKGFI